MKHISSRENPQFVALKKLCENGRERQKRSQVRVGGQSEACPRASTDCGESFFAEKQIKTAQCFGEK